MMEPTCSGPVLLGVFDSPCPTLYCSPYENKIGGYPDCYPRCTLPSAPACCCCGNVLALLAQVYCPLENSIYHRLIQVFCCPQPSCQDKNESWLVLRSQLKDETLAAALERSKQPVPEAKELFSTGGDWCDSADDWGSPKEDSLLPTETAGVANNVDQLLIEKLTISEATPQVDTTSTVFSSRETTHTPDRTTYPGPFYPPGYIYVIEESTSLLETDNSYARKLLNKYQDENPSATLDLDGCLNQSGCSRKGKKFKGGEKKSETHGEGYEKVTAKHGDRAFQKFQKQMVKCPQQLLRYNRGGEPLLITDSCTQQPPKPSQTYCKECGAPCLFEFQLMPTLVYILQASLESEVTVKSCDFTSISRDPVVSQKQLKKDNVREFGMILVYTCSKSCWEEDSLSRIEKAYIQMDTNKIDIQTNIH